MRVFTCLSGFLATAIAFIVFFPMNARADDPKALIENILKARYQFTNFDASIVVEQSKGNLWEMPQKMQYDFRIDEVNQRYWLHRKPLSNVELPEDDPQLKARRSRWLESFAMYRDERWSYGIGGDLNFSNAPVFINYLGYSLFTLGIQKKPAHVWTIRSIEDFSGALGLKLPTNKFSFRSEPQLVNGVTLEGIDCTAENGATRTFWIDRQSMRLHRIETNNPLLSFKLKDGEFGTTTVESSFSSDNETVIPDHVLICETINGIETRRISMELVRFERDKEFSDEDFSYTNMGLRINGFVRDLDTGMFLGYWNGRDWSSKEPITGGKVVSTAIEASKFISVEARIHHNTGPDAQEAVE